MRRRHIDLTATTTAPAATVYRLLADGSTWAGWAPIDSLELERAGDPPPEGVGAVRVIRRGRTTGRDELLELVPDRRIRYRSLSGLPTRDYVGVVELTETPDGGTTIHWHSSFFPKVPGTGRLLERGIRRFLEDCVRGLASRAASEASALRPDSRTATGP